MIFIKIPSIKTKNDLKPEESQSIIPKVKSQKIVKKSEGRSIKIKSQKIGVSLISRASPLTFFEIVFNIEYFPSKSIFKIAAVFSLF